MMFDLIRMIWDIVKRHDGQREEISAAPTSRFSSSRFLGSVLGKGHLEFIRQMSLYLLTQFWPEDNVDSDSTDYSPEVDVIRVALREGKEKPEKQPE